MSPLLVPVLCALLVGVLFGAAGIALDVASVAREARIEAQALPAARRCAHCGWIESKRGTEYTVRMTDGSTRVFEEALPASWRLGERLVVIDGN